MSIRSSIGFIRGKRSPTILLLHDRVNRWAEAQTHGVVNRMQVSCVEGAHWHGRFGVEMVWVQGGPRVVTKQQRAPSPTVRVATAAIKMAVFGPSIAFSGLFRIMSGSGGSSIQLTYPAVFGYSLKCQYQNIISIKYETRIKHVTLAFW
jgi:hypothetical protein